MQKSGSDLIIDYIDELSRGRGRLNSMLSGIMEPSAQGLTGTILSAVVLSRVPPTVPQIGRSLGYPRQTMQRHVEVLIDQGLVMTIENPDHKKARRLVATPEGRATYDRTDKASRSWAKGFADQFDHGDLEIMVRTMQAIRHKLEEATRGLPEPDALD